MHSLLTSFSHRSCQILIRNLFYLCSSHMDHKYSLTEFKWSFKKNLIRIHIFSLEGASTMHTCLSADRVTFPKVPDTGINTAYHTFIAYHTFSTCFFFFLVQCHCPLSIFWQFVILVLPLTLQSPFKTCVDSFYAYSKY